MKLKYLSFFLLPMITYGSVYNEIIPLPNECYTKQNYIPDPTTISQCFALADLEAKRPQKDAQTYYKMDTKGCQNLNHASGLLESACLQSWADYYSFYISYPMEKKAMQELLKPT